MKRFFAALATLMLAGRPASACVHDGSIAMKITYAILLMVVMFAPCETGPHATVC